MCTVLAAHNSGSRKACDPPDTFLGNRLGGDVTEGAALLARGGFFAFSTKFTNRKTAAQGEEYTKN